MVRAGIAVASWDLWGCSRDTANGLRPLCGQGLWRKPTQPPLAELLHNAAYAGAFVYGHRGPHPQRRPGQSQHVRRPMDAWPTIHQDIYPAYVTAT